MMLTLPGVIRPVFAGWLAGEVKQDDLFSVHDNEVLFSLK